MTMTNKTVLVIGGSRGIGAAIASAFAREGANVALTYANSANRANEVVAEIKAMGREAVAIQANAANYGENTRAIEETVKRFGNLDTVIAAAGIFDMAPITDMDEDRFDASFNLHVKGVFEAINTAQKYLPDGGSIVAIGSIFGDVAPFGGLSVYTASKAAVAGLTKAAARDLGGRAITVNTIQPGPINTEMNPADTGMNPMADTQKAMTALGRYGEADEIASLAVYLASDKGGFITGQLINVDGGWTA